MRKAMVLFASLFAGAVSAAGPSADGAEKPDVAEYIMHHVSDSTEYEFEVPLSDEHKIIPLPQIFIPLTAGACDVPAGEAAAAGGHGAAHPGLMQGCLDLSLTKHTVMMFLSALLLVGSILIWSNRDKSKLVPRGVGANLFEMLVVFVRDELAIKNIGKEEGPRYVPYLLTAFFFILFMNMLGLFPWMATATGNIAVTCALALLTFILTQVAGIRAVGFGGYLAHLTGGVAWWLWPIMIPVEILGLFTKPFALTMRLFANMLAGHIVIFFLLGLIFMMNSAAVGLVAVPFAMGIYFLELFVAFVQAYVFTMLSALFIGMGVAMGHHGDHGHGDDHHHGDHPEGAKSHDHGRAHA
ncbi:F0F1 ATP synthase subunit A [Hyalangium sp.]|uniref:F0F1 ATP synthase subunit A n=1 Tax=Hyalangium sp. TaxID=2028555 RepID=UPI002D710CD8|nr:F0F1 ATP synthase subunit A [Hyalangium sp.]HYH97823.1 F0F1 ATP synthase subunit A [Hyalangium sp.]